jgi:hypothetical protein
MTLFARLGGFAADSLDAVASALASASPLKQGGYRIAVTGLQRAGKAVFVTSFVHALLQAKDAPIEAFPFFPWRQRVREVGLGWIFRACHGFPIATASMSFWPSRRSGRRPRKG